VWNVLYGKVYIFRSESVISGVIKRMEKNKMKNVQNEIKELQAKILGYYFQSKFDIHIKNDLINDLKKIHSHIEND